MSAPSPSDPATPAPIETPVAVPTQAIVAPSPTDPPSAEPPAVDASPADSPLVPEPAPTATDAPSVYEPAVPAPIDAAVPEPTPTTGEPGLVDQPAYESFPLLPVALPLPDGVSTAPAHSVASEAARAGAAQPAHEVAAVSPASPVVKAPRLPAPDWVPHMTGLSLPEQLEPVAAGIVAGLAVTNRAPASVAVAIEFGRVGGGWAGAIVFNLWLSRQMRMRRMSQRQLAALSGVDHSTISRLLLHDRRPSLATATKLARALRQVEGESDTADYFERIPEETIFPSRRVEMALRADELLDDEEVRRLMSLYLDARRRRQATMASNGRWSNGPPAAPARAVQSGGASDPRR
jgi:transcriptional regulator with XRE-family HTH domain